jgi:hypothetical protein
VPDTPGKRQRREVKAKRRQAKDERRTSRTQRRDDPNAPVPLLDENGFPVYDEDGYPVYVEPELGAEQPEGTELGDALDGEAAAPEQTA